MRGSGRDRHSRNGQRIIKDSLFPISLFAIYLGVLLLMSGLHVGLVVMMNKLGWNNFVQSVLPVVYWGIVAGGLTLFTRKKMRDTYEEPLHRLAEATEQVANGDFSVYVPTIHTADRLDYVDVMILDFNKMVEELGSVETLKTDFVSNVSHEMKTPIAVIKNYAELLQTGKAAMAVRALSILLTWVVIGVLLYLLASVLLPELYKSVLQLVSNAETYYWTISDWVQHLLETNPTLETWVAAQMDGIYADISVVVDYGYNVPEVAFKIQQTVKHNVEAMTEYKVAKVDVYVVGVDFLNERAAD